MLFRHLFRSLDVVIGCNNELVWHVHAIRCHLLIFPKSGEAFVIATFEDEDSVSFGGGFDKR